MNATDRVPQRCAVVAIHVRQNAKSAWTTPFVPATFCDFPGKISRSLFDEKDLAEITDEEYFPGERLIVCRNPLLADERARQRSYFLFKDS